MHSMLVGVGRRSSGARKLAGVQLHASQRARLSTHCMRRYRQSIEKKKKTSMTDVFQVITRLIQVG